MFKKVLIAEDHEVRNLGVVNTLAELQIQNFDFVNYCDDALQKIKTAATNNVSYDLLITDLSFDKDHIDQKINSGQKLIEEAKKIQPNLKVIAFSIEKKPKIINDLFKTHNINGFVSKGRNDGKDLRNTIRKVFSGEVVIPQEILNSIRNNSFEFTEYDVTLIELLAKGWKQSEIEKFFKENKITPDSRSAIEKRLNDLRFELGAKNNIELIVICKDIGII
ncbi:DNA-binding response regulator, NarL/FixJ family, contains REC and HTH domains [Chryseobacterium wanjuense]|uniref:DNA-binding response regulator, NarL/FixJ family, contains REC and HTH domains n=1 Tax=Chryseobacterium wanjuense TaxID=356305 RepID=A0A1I0RRX0_9FLAO|nr:response regulator [Chryseobacterium wanjuense]SEW44092.1 DNA-binding response regulator, NarL/FixJ family, contains REC and HTH domains [Chryseobacterium wanjuense]